MVSYPSDGANALLRSFDREALEHEYRVFGPPGCGKTHFQQEKIKELIDNGVEGKSIFVASFTRAAAATLTSRVGGIPKQNISTLHAAGYRALGSPEIAESHIPEWNEYVASKSSLQLGRKVGATKADADADADTQGISVEDGGGDKTYANYMLSRAKRLSIADNDEMTQFHAYWTAWKNKNGYVDYADMIELPRVRQIPLPGDVRVGIFDEFQDFTRSEVALVCHWGASMDACYFSGDDDQAIYEFKGASARNFTHPPIPEDRITVLGQSWRVPALPKNLAQQWIMRVPDRMPKKYDPRRSGMNNDGDIIQGEVRRLATEWAHLKNKKYADPQAGGYRLPGVIVDDIIDRYLSQDKSVMFLASCSYMLRPLIGYLRSRGIPFHNKYRLTEREWNPLKAVEGSTGSERILAFLRMRPEVWGEAESRVWTMRDFLLWMNVLDKEKVLNRGVSFKSIEKIAEQWETADPERLGESLDLVEHLSAWLNPDALDWALAQQDISSFEDHILPSKKQGLLFPLNIVKQHPAGARALHIEPQVTVGTIHSVKGGEADVVVLFPDISPPQHTDWKMHDRNALRRLFYVGMTRCKESLIITRPSGFAVPIWQS